MFLFRVFRYALLLTALLATGVIWQREFLGFLALERFDPLPRSEALVAEGRYAEAADYLGFFMAYPYVGDDPDAQALYRRISEKREAWLYQAGKLLEGIWQGSSDEAMGQGAALVSDLLVIGDLRDLSVQGLRLARGEETDRVLVALASLGLLATGAQVVSGAGTLASAGATAPVVVGSTTAKSALVALKAARKLGKLPAWLGRGLVRAATTARESRSLKPLAALLDDVGRLAGRPGGLHLLAETKNAASLSRMARFAETFGSDSLTLYRIAGDRVVRIAQRIGVAGAGTIRLAATFGKGGIRLLDRVGVTTFSKFVARGGKLAYKGEAFKFLAQALLRLPQEILYLILLVGVAAGGVPGLLRRLGGLRAR